MDKRQSSTKNSKNLDRTLRQGACTFPHTSNTLTYRIASRCRTRRHPPRRTEKCFLNRRREPVCARSPGAGRSSLCCDKSRCSICQPREPKQHSIVTSHKTDDLLGCAGICRLGQRPQDLKLHDIISVRGAVLRAARCISPNS